VPTISDVRQAIVVYDVDTLSLVLWDGTVTTEGAPGGGLTDAELRASAVPVSLASVPSHAVTVTKTALTASSPTAASVGVASAQAVATNANRKGLLLTNTHATNRISLGFGAAAVLDSGVTLYPAGTYWMDEYDFTTGAVNAIASGAATNLAIQEYT
jgi:hypothetical protein